MLDIGLIIGILSLLFAIISFWWLNERPGKLLVSDPRSYAAKGSIEGQMILEIPFVFFNKGQSPIIVQNLRLIFLADVHQLPLRFVATVKKLSKDEDRAFATPFPLRGREAILLICEFQREPGGMAFEARSYQMELQGIFTNSKEWKHICRFFLNVSQKSLPQINERFLAYDNMGEEQG